VIGQFHEQFAARRVEPVRVLDALQRLSLERLGTFPAVLHASMERFLAEAGPEAYPELAGLSVLKSRSASDVMAYRQQVAKGFDEFRNPFARAGLSLGLIEEGLIDLHLAGQRLAEILEQRYQTELGALRQQFEELAVALRVPAAPNPVSPARLCDAMVSALSGSGISESLSRLLFRQYQQQLVEILDTLYPNLGAVLGRAGFGEGAWSPADIAGFSGEVPAEAPEPPAPAVQAAPAPAPAERVRAAHSPDLQPLREQLRLWREQRFAEGRRPLVQAQSALGAPAGASGSALGSYAGYRGGAPSTSLRELAVAEVTSIASVLQSEPPDAFARALASTGRLADVIRASLADGARRLGLHPESATLSEEDEDAVDMVALLFESLFRTHALQDRARRVYARLVLPYVKVALNDEAMFVEREHPARRLLDVLTEACEDNTGSTPQDRELLERASAVSQRVVAEFNEDIAVFELAYAELDDLLAQQRRRVELQEQRAAKASFGRERLAQARETADALLQLRLTAAPLTQAIGDFLATPWRHHLVQTLLREGEDSPRFRDAVQMGDALAHADALAARADGAALVRQLIALEAPLTECLASSGLDSTAASHGLAGIVRGLANPDAARRLRPMPPAVRDEPEQESRLWLAGGTATVRHDPAVAATLRELEVGAWLRLTDAQGDTVSVKLAWVSPLTSRLLLVNRRGMRVLVAGVEELAILAADGRLVVDTGRSPFDAAMRQLQDQLGMAVGYR
jgi:hypothetical protein